MAAWVRDVLRLPDGSQSVLLLQWVGTDNYTAIATDPLFWTAVRNTVWIIAVGVPARVVFAIATGMLLTKVRRGGGLFRTIFFLPSLAPPVAATLGFVYLLNPATGPVDQLLRKLHLPAPLWFNDPRFAKPLCVRRIDTVVEVEIKVHSGSATDWS